MYVSAPDRSRTSPRRAALLAAAQLGARTRRLYRQTLLKRPYWLGVPVLLVALAVGYTVLNNRTLPLLRTPVGGPSGTIAGVVPGDFEVSANGDSTYTIQIEVPPGIDEVEPDLSLVYSSHAGNGRLGVGWQLQGFSAITRCDATPAVDQFRGTVSYGPNDRYCLDGQRLINVSGAYGSPGTLYHTELETWRQVRASQEMCGSGPCSFTVVDKRGNTYSYGTSADSQIKAVVAGKAAPDVRAWALQKQGDLNGNTLAVSYTQTPLATITQTTQLADGQYYPLRIDYTANSGAGVAANRSVRFAYEARDDIITEYAGGGVVTTRARLTDIQTFVNDTSVADYHLSYNTSLATGRSQVTSVQECNAPGPDAACLPATTFHWQGQQQLTFALQEMQPQTPVAAQTFQMIPLDANGDGRGDFVNIWGDSATLNIDSYLSNGSTFSLCNNSTQISYADGKQLDPMDVNGDGRTDLVQIWTDSSSVLEFTIYFARTDSCGFMAGVDFNTQEAANYTQLWPMDVNGDGRTDFVGAWINQGALDLISFLGSGSSFAAGGTAAISIPPNSGQPWPMDVNGDGMIDLVQPWSDQSGSLKVTAYLSNGTSFAGGIDTDLQSGTVNAVYWPMEINDDGRMDLLQVWKQGDIVQISAYFADGAGHFVFGNTTNTERGAQSLADFWPADSDGDGSTEIVQKWRNAQGRLNLVAYRYTGTGFDHGTDSDTDLSATSVGIWPLDVSGNGRMDLVQIWSDGSQLNFTGYIAQGAVPDLVDTIVDGLGDQVAISYKPMSDTSVYTQTVAVPSYPTSDALTYVYQQAPAQYPFQTIGGGKLRLVSHYVESNVAQRNSAPYSYSYTMVYADALNDLQGRGWLGFRTVIQIDQQTGLRTVSHYNQQFPMTGTVADVEYRCDGASSLDQRCPRDAASTLLTAGHTVYAPTVVLNGDTPPNSPVYQVLQRQTRSDTYDYGAYRYSRGKTYDYDAYGNLTRQSDLGYVDPSGKDLGADDNVYTCAQFSQLGNTQGWLPNYPTATKVSASTQCDYTTFAPGVDFSLEQTAYTTDGRMNAAAQRQWDSSNQQYLVTSFDYDPFGHIITQTEPGNRASKYSYETQYNTYLQTRTSPPNAAGQTLVETYGFDPRFGIQSAFTDANKNTSIVCVDLFGRLLSQQGPLPVSASVSPDQNCVSSLVTGPAAQFAGAPVVTLQSYQRVDDGAGNVYIQANNLQSWGSGTTRDMRWQREYLDGRGRTYEQVLQGTAPATTIYRCSIYDSEDRETRNSIAQYASDGNPVCAPAARPAASVATTTPPGAGPSFWSTSTYDVYGRMIRNILPAGPQGSETSVTSIGYSSGDYTVGDTATVTYAAQDTYALTKTLQYKYYNSEHKAYRMIVPGDNNATTTYTYDRIGRLTGVSDPKAAANIQGVSNTITYDSLDRKLTVDNPDQNTTDNPAIKALAYTYSPIDGFLQSTLDAQGRKTTFAYDGWGRVTQKNIGSGTIINFTYDAPGVANGLGNLTGESAQRNGATLYSYTYGYDTYDHRNTTTLAIQGEATSYVTKQSYDPLDRVYQLTYPDQTVASWNYQWQDLLNVSVGATTYVTFTNYTALGNPQNMVYGNGVQTQYSYAPTAEMIGQSITDAKAQGLLNNTIRWDHLNRVMQIFDNLKPGGTDFTQSFFYKSSRLDHAQASGLYGTRQYGYDESGNLTLKDGVTYTYIAHRIQSGSQGGAKLFQASYDATGNLQTKQQNGNLWQYSYDTSNRLAEVKQNNTTILSIPIYNDQGDRLVKQDAAGNITLYISPEYEVTKYADGSRETTKYVTSPGMTIAAISSVVSGNQKAGGSGGYPSQGTLYFNTDHLGSTSLTTDASGQLASRLVYLPYGELYQPKTSGPDNFRPKFQGQELDETTQLYYFGARYYDPSIGRFISPDTQLAGDTFEIDSFNRFAFAVNSPVTYTDPTGHGISDNIAGAVIGVAEIVAGVAIDILSGGALEPIAGALIGAGTDALLYSLTTKPDNFSWKQYGIQMGIGAALGFFTGGFGGEAAGGLRTVERVGQDELAAAAEQATARETSLAIEDSAGDALESSARRGARDTEEELSESSDLVSQAACLLNSFVAGTLVQTQGGPRPIEQIQPGDLVLAKDDASGQVDWRPVTATISETDDTLLDLEFVTKPADGEHLQTTPHHPFWVRGEGWVEAIDLEPGDEVYSAISGWVLVVRITSLDGPHTVYNFEVGEFHSYFVGRAGIWVHNPKQKSCRERAVGKTPGKGTRTGREVRDRWVKRGKARLVKGKWEAKVRVTRGGPRVWKPLDKNIHMGHRIDAVDWWNKIGWKLGAKSKAARQFMLDAKHYRFEWGPLNSSNGAKLGITYRRPRGWVGPWP